VRCIHVAVIVVCQVYVNNKRRACYMQVVLSILLEQVFSPIFLEKYFPLRHARLSLKLEGNADCQLHGSSRKPSVQIAINVLSVMWPSNIGRCSTFVCNSERDAPVRRWSGILMCGGFERFESLGRKCSHSNM
jgi:hypothetical protein